MTEHTDPPGIDTSGLPGIDTSAIQAWLGANIPAAVAPFTYERLPGGHSNLTYLLTDAAGSELVLRRPPEGELLASAHDMGREYKVMTALGSTPVPVPITYGMNSDPGVTGAPFYVMSHVWGHVLHDEQAAEVYDHEQRQRASDSLIDALGALHQIDPDEVGLGDFARKREGYVGRQLRRWYGQYEQTKTRDIPALDDLYPRLESRVPAEQRISIVHGDYRLGNCLTDETGAVAAILDWEISTLGDPLADIGYLLATWIEEGPGFATITTPSTAPGFRSRAEMAERYAQVSGLDCSQMDFYVAFSYFKMACINQGVYYRYVQGQKSADGVDVEAIGDSVVRLADHAVAAFGALT